MSVRSAAAAALLAIAAPTAAAAQGVTFGVGHFFAEQPRSVVRLEIPRPMLGPLGLSLHAMALASPAGAARPLFGGGADFSLFQDGRAGLYAVAGVDAGLGLREAETFWGSWSAGVGYEFFPFDIFVLGVEGRWRELQPGYEHGAELSVRLGARFGGARRNAPQPRVPQPRAGAGPAVTTARPSTPSAVAAALDEVVRTAEAAIGTRYQLGGSGTSGNGFDCSGLIQYAYAQQGVALPRRSVEQAESGREIGRDPGRLMPGDVLTFAQSGSRVTHVGLYVGGGRFIHSASRGVRVSRLSDDDPDGRYWLRRWVGSRRILE